MLPSVQRPRCGCSMRLTFLFPPLPPPPLPRPRSFPFAHVASKSDKRCFVTLLTLQVDTTFPASPAILKWWSRNSQRLVAEGPSSFTNDKHAVEIISELQNSSRGQYRRGFRGWVSDRMEASHERAPSLDRPGSVRSCFQAAFLGHASHPRS